MLQVSSPESNKLSPETIRYYKQFQSQIISEIESGEIAFGDLPVGERVLFRTNTDSEKELSHAIAVLQHIA